MCVGSGPTSQSFGPLLILPFSAKGEEMKPKAVLFDVEGTLIDMVEIYLKDINEIARRLGLRGMDKETVRRMMREQQAPWEYLVSEAEGDREQLLAQCRKIDSEIFYKIYLNEAEPFPQVVETMEKLVAGGVKLGIVSSAWGLELHRFDWGRKMLQLVAVIITRKEVPVLKPAPDPILECLRRLDVSPHDTVYVGDSPVDIKAGKAAGTMTIGLLCGTSDYDILQQETPDFILPGVKDLLTVISI
jgi:HAD superfamily hydrolase (TIGR01509 family)